MKKLMSIVCALVLVTVVGTACDNDEPTFDKDSDLSQYDDYFWLGGEKIPLQKVDGKFQVTFYSCNEAKLEEVLTKVGATLTDVAPEGDLSFSLSSDYLSPVAAEIFTDYKTATIEGDYEKIAPALIFTIYWAPYYIIIYDDREVFVSFTFSVKFKPDTDLRQLEKLAEENSVLILGEDTWLGTHLLACTNLSNGNALEMANLFYESGLFEYSDPSLSGTIIPLD
jgi:hypothetical protein